MHPQSAGGPQLLIEPESRQPGAGSDRWLVTWRMRNLGSQPLQLLAARLPHDQFWTEEQGLNSMPALGPGETRQLELTVKCTRLHGQLVNNVFLILRVLWEGQPWRVFARLRVVFDEGGAPENAVETVTTQPVGFSQRNRG